jgi:hypothetical protein
VVVESRIRENGRNENKGMLNELDVSRYATTTGCRSMTCHVPDLKVLYYLEGLLECDYPLCQFNCLRHLTFQGKNHYVHPS